MVKVLWLVEVRNVSTDFRLLPGQPNVHFQEVDGTQIHYGARQHCVRTFVAMAILLTQSQVSVAVTTTVVTVFTVLLFFAGWSLQVKSTESLREAIKPRLPQPPPLLKVQSNEQRDVEQIPASRHFVAELGSKSKIAYPKFLKAEDRVEATVDWKRLAHVQLVSSHHDMCNAIMVFGELNRLKSPARRVLMFPAAWALEKQKTDKGDISDPYLDSSRRLMRLAARRYAVELRPMNPIAKHQEDGDAAADHDEYSLASAYSLTEFERVMVLETPGLLLDASPLDGILAFTEHAPLAMLYDTVTNDGVHSEDMFLLEPNRTLHNELTTSLSMPDADTTLAKSIPDPLLIASSSPDAALVRAIGVLHGVGHDFNRTAYLQNVAYIRFWDPKLPGPEYDVPWSMKREARPKNKDADWVWTKMYGSFAQKRMEICGLDLDHWRSEE